MSPVSAFSSALQSGACFLRPSAQNRWEREVKRQIEKGKNEKTEGSGRGS